MGSWNSGFPISAARSLKFPIWVNLIFVPHAHAGFLKHIYQKHNYTSLPRANINSPKTQKENTLPAASRAAVAFLHPLKLTRKVRAFLVISQEKLETLSSLCPPSSSAERKGSRFSHFHSHNKTRP